MPLAPQRRPLSDSRETGEPLTDLQTRPDLDAGTYATPMDKSMHELHLSHVGEPTEYLDFATEGAR